MIYLPFSVEEPFFSESDRRKLFEKYMPEKLPTMAEKYNFLQEFSRGVEYIIQTVSEREYQAATTFMRAPGKMFSKAAVFPITSMVLGLFGDTQIKTALIQTAPGTNVDDYIEDAINAYPNARYVIGVGACYAFDDSTYKLGDVIVSKKIADLANFEAKLNKQKKTSIVDYGETIEIVTHLHKVFCLGKDCYPKYQVTEDGRYSEVHDGTLISHPIHMNNKKIRDAFLAPRDMAIGGEMEGGQLMKLVSKRKVDGVVMVKGVSNYGHKDEKWRFTATMAALHYVEQKLSNVQGRRDKPIFWSSPFLFFVLSTLSVFIIYSLYSLWCYFTSGLHPRN